MKTESIILYLVALIICIIVTLYEESMLAAIVSYVLMIIVSVGIGKNVLDKMNK